MVRRLVAEWELQSALCVTWPHPWSDWRPVLDQIEPVYVAMVRAVTPHQPMVVVCFNDAVRHRVARLLKQAGVAPPRVRSMVVPSNDTWIRDYGPLVVEDHAGALLVDFRFDGWGGQYDAGLDDRVTARLHERQAFGDVPLNALEHILEGGSVDTDGQGTLLTSEGCLTARANAVRDRPGIEALLRETLGVQRALWLTHGRLSGDDTGGHVDTLARFCDPCTIAYVHGDDPAHPDYESLRAMESELTGFRTAKGAPYRLVPLPEPPPCFGFRGERLPASYANFVIINGAVLVPIFEAPSDERAMEALEACFPERELVGIPSIPLIRQYGGPHCASFHLPASIPCPRLWCDR